jgi:hypothetical protein
MCVGPAILAVDGGAALGSGDSRSARFQRAHGQYPAEEIMLPLLVYPMMIPCLMAAMAQPDPGGGDPISAEK